MVINQYEIWWINLDPTVGSEIQKVRPCVVVSPDEMNHHIRTILIAPMTSTSKPYPSRVSTTFEGRVGWVVLDQIRCVDKSRLVKKASFLDSDTVTSVKSIIRAMLVE